MISGEVSSFVGQSLNSPNFDIQPLAGDASSRRYYRVVHQDQTTVLMVWEPFADDGRFPFLNVQQHFAKHQVRVPKVLARDPLLGVILLEDLGDLTLERKFWENQNQKLAIPFYQQAIDEILKIHVPATLDRTTNCVAFTVQFDVAKLLWELHYGRDHLFDKLAGISLSGPTKTELDKEFIEICTILDNEPKRICHRDYHSRNLMIHRGRAHMIDFQDARMGSIQYDLVSLVHDSYVDLDQGLQNEILDYYIIRFQELTKTKVDRAHFDYIMQIQKLQRCFKACGSFSSFFNMREDRRYLKYIGPTLRKVHLTLTEFPQFSTFRKLIEDNDLQNKDYLSLPGSGSSVT